MTLRTPLRGLHIAGRVRASHLAELVHAQALAAEHCHTEPAESCGSGTRAIDERA
jgi:hypothetical protein